MTDLKKEVALVFGKFYLGILPGSAGELFYFVHGFLGDQYLHFAVQAGKLLIGFGQGQAMPIGGDHGKGVWFQN